MIRHRAAGLTLVLCLVLGGTGACSDDGGDGAETTITTTTQASAETSGQTTTLPDETTTTAAPPTAGPIDLQARLLDPAVVGDGFTLDATLGTGAFSGELCEDVTLEPTWADQASQALARGAGEDRELVTQAVLDFAGEGEAEDFVPTLVEGNETCLSGEVLDIEAGDEAVLIDIPSGDAGTSVAVVRRGARVATFSALYPTEAGTPITQELLVAAGEALAG